MPKSFGQCSICYLAYEINDIASLKCGHAFHNGCISKWINTSKFCPNCRTRNTAKDIIRLYINESDNSHSQSQLIEINSQDNTEIVAQLKIYESRLNEAKDSNMAMNLQIQENNESIKALKKEFESEKKKLTKQLEKKDQHITHLERILVDQGQLKKELEDSKRRVKASEFYVYLRKSHEEDMVEAAIDEFIKDDGDLDTRKFMGILKRQCKGLLEKNRVLYESLTEQKTARVKLERENHKLMDEIKENSRKRHLGRAPAKTKMRPSMGFSFDSSQAPAEFEDQEQEFVAPLDDSDIEVVWQYGASNTKNRSSVQPVPPQLHSAPPLRQKQEFSMFIDSDEVPRSSEIQQRPFSFFESQKMAPYLNADEVGELLSPKLVAHAKSMAHRK